MQDPKSSSRATTPRHQQQQHSSLSSPERSRVAHRRREGPSSLSSPSPISEEVAMHNNNNNNISSSHYHHHRQHQQQHDDPNRSPPRDSNGSTQTRNRMHPPSSVREALLYNQYNNDDNDRYNTRNTNNELSSSSALTSPPAATRLLQQQHHQRANTANHDDSATTSSTTNNQHHRDFKIDEIPTVTTSSSSVSSSIQNQNINNVSGVSISAAGTFVVSEAIVAMTTVKVAASSSSSFVWTADENGWIRVRDHRSPHNPGEVIKQWRLTSSSSSSSSSSTTAAAKVTCMWSSSSSSSSNNPVVMIGREDGIISVYSAVITFSQQQSASSSSSSSSAPAHLGDLSLHQGLVSSITSCSSGDFFVASCGFDGRVAVWDTRSLRCVTSTKLQVDSTSTTALLCMTAFPTALRHHSSSSASLLQENNNNSTTTNIGEPAWWIAVGGSASSSSAPLFVLRASDLSSVTTDGKPLMIKRSTTTTTTNDDNNNKQEQQQQLFAMTSIVCVSDNFSASSMTQTKYLWCGCSDGTVVVFSASASLGVERIQSMSLVNDNDGKNKNKNKNSRSRNTDDNLAISHMITLTNNEDDSSYSASLTVWVFTADGFLTVFDSNRRIPIQRMPASVSSAATASSSSDYHNNNKNLPFMMRMKQQRQVQQQQQQFVLTCVSPISVTKTWKVWSAAEDGTVRVWNMTSSSSVNNNINNNTNNESLDITAITANTSQQQQGATSININEVELLRNKLLDAREQMQLALEREASTKKIARLDMEDAIREYSERLREAELTRDDVIEKLESLKETSAQREQHLREDNMRLEDEVMRYKRRSVERAASQSHAQQQQEEQQREERNRMMNEISTLKLQLAESKSAENASSVALTVAQQQLDQLQRQHDTTNTSQQQQETNKNSLSTEKLQEALLHQQQKLLDLTQSENLLQAELRMTKSELAQFKHRSDATFVELERKASDYDKMLQTTSNLRTALDEASQRATKAEQQVEFLRKELSTHHHGFGGYSSPPLSHNNTTGRTLSPNRHRPQDLSLNNLSQHQNDLESLEASWQERQSQMIRELYDLRQQLERKQLDIKTVENDLRVARSDIDGLRSELRASMDETAKSERQREDAELEHERAIRDVRAEERRTTEAEVSSMYRNRLVEIERELQMAMDKTAKQESEIKFLQDEIRTMEKRRDATVQRDTAHVQELNKLLASNSDQLKQKEIEIGKMQAEHEQTVQELRAEVLHCQREAADQKRAREALEVAAKRQLTIVSTEMNQVDADVQQLHRQLTDGSSMMQRAQLQDELSSVKEQLQQAQRELSSRRMAAVQIEADRHVMETKLLSEKAETNRARSELDAANRQMQLHKDEITSLQSKLQNAQRETQNSLEIAEKKYKSEIELLQQQLNSSRSDVSTAKAEIDLLHKRINEENARHSAEVIDIKSNAAKEKAELSTKLDHFERQVSSGVITQQMASWQRRLDDATMERESQRDMISTLKKQLEQAERNMMATQTEHERTLQEQRRAIMGERNETANKINKLETEITNKEAALNLLKEQHAVHQRECPMKDSNSATLLAEKKSLSVQADDLQDRMDKAMKREKAVSEELIELQRTTAEKEFEHVREMKMQRIENENKLRDLQLQHKEELQKLRTLMNEQKQALVSSESQQLQHQQQLQSSPSFHQLHQQQIENTTAQLQQKRYIKELEDESETMQKKIRRQKEEIEELERKLHQQQSKQPTTQQQQVISTTSQNNNNNNQQSSSDFQMAIAKMREQSIKLQKEKAALQMQLMRRDEEFKEFENTHVNKMLEEMNQLRHDRDKALLDCTRLTNDIHQLQQQLCGESQIRESLASRIDSNAAHVTTVHGSLRAVMLEAANREKFLEDQIKSLQVQLQHALAERSEMEESTTRVETALYSNTTKSLIAVESQVAKLLSGLLLLLEQVRDKPTGTLGQVMPMVVSAVEGATQSVQLIRNELGFMSGASLVMINNNQNNNNIDKQNHSSKSNNNQSAGLNSSFQTSSMKENLTSQQQHHQMKKPHQNISGGTTPKLSSSSLFAEAASKRK